MNRDEANREAKKIYDNWQTERDRIENEAKQNGIWQNEGLDSNNHLFTELNNETKEKLQLLKALFDKE